MDSLVDILLKVHPKISIPILLLGLKVAMKLLVGRETKSKHVFEILCELPNDIIFLAISFSFVYFFLDDVNNKNVIVLSLTLIIIAFIVFSLIRQCRKLGDDKLTLWKGVLLVILIILNFSISGIALYCSSSYLLNDPLIKNCKQIIEINKTIECK